MLDKRAKKFPKIVTMNILSLKLSCYVWFLNYYQAKMKKSKRSNTTDPIKIFLTRTKIHFHTASCLLGLGLYFLIHNFSWILVS